MQQADFDEVKHAKTLYTIHPVVLPRGPYDARLPLSGGEEIRDNISNDLAGGGAHFAVGLEEPPPFLLLKFHKSSPYPPSPISIIGEMPAATAASVVLFSASMARISCRYVWIQDSNLHVNFLPSFSVELERSIPLREGRYLALPLSSRRLF